jgi:hypothetical protein
MKMGGNTMTTTLGAWWQKIVRWISILGSAHVVDDGSDEKKDGASNNRPTKLHLVPRNNQSHYRNPNS